MELTVPHLCLAVGAQGLEGLCQGDPLLELLLVTLGVQGGEEHDEVGPQSLVMVAPKHAERGGQTHSYQPEESKATLSAQNAATQHQVVVQTTFVEPFEPIIGAQYLVVGEIENSEGGDGVMVRARVLNCVDGLNLALLQRAVNEQRSYFRERMESKGDAPP
ncbi:unnamed protein product [Coregonus sp. 'balchen']|nr:unnamed protein product [Coregonus sp. 'balchen']